MGGKSFIDHWLSGFIIARFRSTVVDTFYNFIHTHVYGTGSTKGNPI